jgi:hypothetical protein
MSARPFGCPAGSIASAITAICSSRTCATTTDYTVVTDTDSAAFKTLDRIRVESVVTVDG